jgi:hypothetical protein
LADVIFGSHYNEQVESDAKLERDLGKTDVTCTIIHRTEQNRNCDEVIISERLRVKFENCELAVCALQ